MIIYSANDIEMAFGADILFSGVSFDIDKNDKIGLVGMNGTGKTTLFKLMKGELEPEKGTFAKSREAVMGYMEQHVVRDSTVSVYDEALSVFSRLMESETELERLHAEIDAGAATPENLEKQMRLQEKFEADGGLTYKARTASALAGMGFSAEEQKKQVSVLSGGEKSKIQLVKLLLSGANLLLLDEPTNHLDIDACEWLEKFLLEYKGAYVIISHDRYFLDKVTTKTLEIENRRMTAYKGGYTEYKRQKEENYEIAMRHYENQLEEIRRIEGIIEQQKRWNQAHNYVTIASKQKQIDRLREELVKPMGKPKTLHFRFECRESSGNEVLQANALAKRFDGKYVFRSASLDIRKNERVFLMGGNGCGKTTLFRILTKEYSADEGVFRLGAGVKIGYFDQIQTGLTDTKTVLDEVWDCYPKMSQTEVRTALGSFLFFGDDVFKKISCLSGGEKAKVALLKLMLSGCNLLLLDEPTNHLDITSREALEAAIEAYTGTLFVISHDRYLINKAATRLCMMTENGIEAIDGGYDDYIALKERIDGEKTAAAKPEKPKINDYKQRKERESEIRKLKTRISRAEAEIDRLDGEIAEINRMLSLPEHSSDFEKITELTTKLGELQEEYDRQLSEWEQAGDLLEAAESE